VIGSGIQRPGRNCASRRCTIIIGRSAFSLPLKGEAAHVRMAKTVPDPSTNKIGRLTMGAIGWIVSFLLTSGLLWSAAVLSEVLPLGF
jgi:hypothetical protein